MSAALVGFLFRRHWLTCGLCLLAPLVVGAVAGYIFPMMREDMKVFESLSTFIDRFSPLDLKDLVTPQGFFAIPFNHPLSLTAMAVAPAIPAIGLLAGERGRGGLDLLLATRLERRSLIVSLMLFLVPVTLLMGAAPLAGIALGATISGVMSEVSWEIYSGLAANAFLLSLNLASIATLLSVLAEDRGRVTTWFAIFVFVAVLLAFLAGIWDEGASLRYATPVGYLDVPAAIQNRSELAFDGPLLGASAAVFFGLAFWLESRRRRV